MFRFIVSYFQTDIISDLNINSAGYGALTGYGTSVLSSFTSYVHPLHVSMIYRWLSPSPFIRLEWLVADSTQHTHRHVHRPIRSTSLYVKRDHHLVVTHGHLPRLVETFLADGVRSTRDVLWPICFRSCTSFPPSLHPNQDASKLR